MKASHDTGPVAMPTKTPMTHTVNSRGLALVIRQWLLGAGVLVKVGEG
jgi:hypothetical protein